jgi:hypothetical protein
VGAPPGRTPARRQARARSAKAQAGVLAPDWQAWVLENLAGGAPRTAVAGALQAHGVPTELAHAAVAALATSPLVDMLRAAAARDRRAAQVLQLQAQLHREACGRVPRETGLSAEVFFARYWASNHPVILPDVMTGWAALRRWGPDDFAARFGDVPVEVCVGRDRSAAPDRHHKKLTKTMPLGDFARRVSNAGVTNDLYMIANNKNMERPALLPLLDDVVIPVHLIDHRHLKRALTLWFGPAGTRTPLHHDTCNILFCQVTGQKRFRLVPPFVQSLLDEADGFYAAPDVLARLDPALVLEVVLSPGEALFLPVGWWHEVEALAVSVSLSFTRFHRANRFDWYGPGTLPARST